MRTVGKTAVNPETDQHYLISMPGPEPVRQAILELEYPPDGIRVVIATQRLTDFFQLSDEQKHAKNVSNRNVFRYDVVAPQFKWLLKNGQLIQPEGPKTPYFLVGNSSGIESSQSEKITKIKNLDDFMEWARKFDRGAYVFRGVPNEVYGIQASAYRRPKHDRNFEKFLQINKDLIREARLRGYDQKNGRELKPLEILAELQHYGAATCLIDFTYNAQAALRFACKEDSKKPQDSNETQDQKNQQNLKNLLNGKVFAVRKNPPSRFREIVPELLKEDIDFFLQDNEESQLYCWQPRQQNNRIIAQQSIFLFGRYEFAEDNACIIDGNSKKDIMNMLQQVSGITEDSLFPDFEGFAHMRREEEPYTELTATQYRDRGFLADKRMNYKDAISDYDIAISKNPKYAEVYYLRGLAQKSLKQQGEAIVDFDEAIRLDYKDPKVYYERGAAKFKLRQYKEAIVDFDDAIHLDPKYAEAYYLIGRAKSRLEGYGEAIVDFDDAIRLDFKDAQVYYWRGYAKYHLKRCEEAIVDFDEAIRLDFKDAQVYYWRGLSKKHLKQYESSIADFDITIPLKPTFEEAYYHRGEAKFRLDRFVEAQADLNEASSLAKDNNNNTIIRLALNLLDEIESGRKSQNG